MPDDSKLPVRQVPLDRATIERVLARAAELQPTGDDGESNLSESQLLEIGKEVGISQTTLTQALAEERSRVAVPEDQSVLSSITGPAAATASRAIRGTPIEILATIDAWMQRDECLQVQRRFPDRITWEPKAGWLGVIQRGLNVNGRGYHLCRATQVAATVVDLGDGRVLVRLDADLSESRNAKLKTGAGIVTGGIFGAGALGGSALLAHVAVLAAGGLAAIPLLIGAGIAYQIGKSHRALITRAQLALEQTLDRLEFGNTRRLR
ncbi:MAG TPA: hypothetical protein VM099_13125 [Gemmatimonadaceae bacterium]|nr:hypothetical protein [Gemmatimonadaceae bacterium]